jgi:ankyrin repeat protein
MAAGDQEMIQLLLAKGANPATKDEKGRSPEEFAIATRREERDRARKDNVEAAH